MKNFLLEIGGKGKGLWSLQQFGLEIPETLVLSEKNFENFLSLPEISILYEQFLKCVYRGPSLPIFEAAAKLREGIEKVSYSCPFSKEEEKTIKEFFLKHKKIVMRSSCSQEDGEKHSFAGLFQSYFEQESKEQFQQTLKKMYSETFSSRVLSYCLERQIPIFSLKMSLLLQPQLDLEISGVLFTIHHDKENEGVITYTPHACGAKLMEGEISGKTYFISRVSGQIKQEGKKEEFLKKLQKIWKKSLQLEEKMGFPLDIEWGIESKNNRLVFFQVRPITITIQKKSNIVWTRKLSEERYPLPISPLGWSVLHPVFYENLKSLRQRFGLEVTSQEEVAKVIHQYVYANDSFFNFPENVKANYAHFLSCLPSFFSFFLRERKILKKYLPLRVRLWASFFKSYLFIQAKEIISLWDANLPMLNQKFDELGERNLENFSIKELLEFRKTVDHYACRYMEPDLAIYLLKMAFVFLLKKISTKLFPEEAEEYLVLKFSSGLFENQTLLMNEQLVQLCEKIRPYTNLVEFIKQGKIEKFLEEIKEEKELFSCYTNFVEKNGHLTDNWDLKIPTWQEGPQKIFSLLLPLLDCSFENFKIKRKTNKEQSEKFYQDCEQKFGHFFCQALLKELKFFLREFMRIDEEHHFYCSRVFKAARNFYLEIGRRFCLKGILQSQEEIFFLEHKEILFLLEDLENQDKKIQSLELCLSWRSKLYHQAFFTNPPLSYGDKEKEEKGEKKEKDKNVLKGTGACSGISQGRAFVLTEIEQAKFIQEGDILVVQGPNPVYTPLYSKVSGLITGTGAILSHGLVAAREYNLPAITLVEHAHLKIKTGDIIWMNGNTGEIKNVTSNSF